MIQSVMRLLLFLFLSKCTFAQQMCSFELHTALYTTVNSNGKVETIPMDSSSEVDGSQLNTKSLPPVAIAMLNGVATSTPTPAVPIGIAPSQTANGSEGNTTSNLLRFLQQLPGNLPNAAGSNAVNNKANGTSNGATNGTSNGTTKGTSNGTTNGTTNGTSNGMSNAADSNSSSAVDNGTTRLRRRVENERMMNCNEEYYGKWISFGMTCGGQNLNVTQAANAAACSIYNGNLNDGRAGQLKSCMQICSFPACRNGTWIYNDPNGINSALYRNMSLGPLVGNKVVSNVLQVTNGASGFLGNVTYGSRNVCENRPAFNIQSNLNSCQCAASFGKTNQTTQSRYRRVKSVAKSSASYVTPTAEGAAAFTVSTGIVLVMSSGSVSSATVATASSATAVCGASLAMVTVDVCQFTTSLGLLNKDCENTKTLCDFTDSFSATSFTYLAGFVPKNENAVNRRLQEATNGSSNGTKLSPSGVEDYADRINLEHDQLLYVTLAGIAGVFLMIMFVYAFCLFLVMLCRKSVRKYALKWWDSVVGTCVLVGILSQYVVGVTATYEIYRSIKNSALTLQLVVAICSLVFFALGIIFFGVMVIRNHERELRDVGTYGHTKKSINKRYGALYDEFTYDHRFFFAPKLALALASGIITGMSLLGSVYQIVALITLHIAFLFYLEMQRPYQTRFLQNTATLVTIMKISALVLTFFLISSLSFIPSELKPIVSYVIIAIQLGVLLCLMGRQFYILYKKFREGRNEKKRLSESSQGTQNTEGSHDIHLEHPSIYEDSSMCTPDSMYYEDSISRRNTSSQSYRSTQESNVSSAFTNFSDYSYASSATYTSSVRYDSEAVSEYTNDGYTIKSTRHRAQL